MRYYDIQVYNTDGSKYAQYISLIPASAANTNALSLYSGTCNNTNASALNIEMTIQQSPMHAPSGDSSIKIWGPDLKDFTNARSFNGKLIKVFGGMQKGLPLANPKQ